jgi:probable rRNA maturation factor
LSELPVVVGIDDQDDHPIDLGRWTALAEQVLTNEGVGGPSELNLTFIDQAEMTDLNVEHMGGTGPTDVLSFPLDDADPTGLVEGQPRLLGDIMICPQIVHGQAPGHPDDELALMVVHGVLHILGMDHAEPEETIQMKAAEQRHLERWRSS